MPPEDMHAGTASNGLIPGSWDPGCPGIWGVWVGDWISLAEPRSQLSLELSWKLL